MQPHRRSVLAALGVSLPFAADAVAVPPAPPSAAPALRLVPFEEAVRAAFRTASVEPVRRVAVGWCDLVQAGLQGCVNRRAFAGFPPGVLRIVRTGSEPGPVVGGVRLFVATVDVAVGFNPWLPARRLDFALLPPAPALAERPA